MPPITLSVFFPVYNEKENLRLTVLRTLRTLADSPFIRDFEILLIDDGSTDGSGEMADEFAQALEKVFAIHHVQNRGYGAALKTGISAARMDYIFFTDADLQFDIMELHSLLAHVAHYPVVVGYRAPRRDPFMRLVNAWGWNVLNRSLFGLRIRDIDCAFKIFKRSLVQGLPLKSKGAMISAETLIRLTRRGIPVKEVPVSHLPRERGNPTGAKLSVIYRAFEEMIELYRGELGLVTHKELLKFMAVGVVNTLLDATLYIGFTRFTPLFAAHLVAAKFFSFLGGTISSLILNRRWTFGIRTRLTGAEVARFYAMTSVSLLVNVLLMNALVGAGIYDLVALTVTTVFTFVTNFTLSKFWVFKMRKDAEEEAKSYVAS